MIKLNKTTKYAILVLLHLERHTENRISARELHQILDIPYKYLTQIMKTLDQAEYVEVKQGKYGGYRILEDRKISIGNLIDTLEGQRDITTCMLRDEVCELKEPCALHNHLVGFRESIYNVFNDLSIEELAEQISA